MTDSSIPARNASLQDVEAVVAHYALTDADDIRLLTDFQLLRIPGIGRTRLTRLRQDFPLDEARLDAAEAQEEQARQNRIAAIEEEQRSQVIKLGHIHDVTAVQFMEPCLVVATRRSPSFRLIDIRWDADLAEEDWEVLGTFGPTIDPAEVPNLDAFPCIYRVTSIEVVRGNVFPDFRVLEVRIKSAAGVFTFNLFLENEGECPVGPEIDTTDYGARTLSWELEKCPEAGKAKQRCARGFERISQALSSGKASVALQTYCAIQKDVALVLSSAGQLAELRGLQVRPESFGLTQSDRRGSASSQEVVPAEGLFIGHPSPIDGGSPMTAAGNLLRHVLDRGADKAGRGAVQKILAASSWMDAEQRARVSHCLTILDEIRALRREIAEAGIAGVKRKSIISGIDERHGEDGGMARRAILRWLESAEAGLIKIAAPKGTTYRTDPDQN